MEFELEYVLCDLCGSSDCKPVMKKRGVVSAHEFTIVRCSRCGLVYVNPRIVESQIGLLYGDAYYRGEGFDRTIDYTREPNPAAVNDGTTGGIIATLRDALGTLEGARVLDAGCGTGTLLRGLLDAGARAEGVEFSEAARTRCRARGLTIAGDSIFDASIGRGRYDAVTAIEVIEHLTSPTEFLCRIREILKPGGIFYFTTGNWHLVRHAEKAAYVMPEGHLHYFTPRIARKYFEKTGFAPVRGVLNRAWIGYRGLPRPLARRVPARLLLGLAGVSGDVAPFPIGRRVEI